MPENIPNIPSGAFPPKKETGKVQPKKETVRINLPPKPSTAPTIKLPAVPPSGLSAGPMAGTAPAAAPAPALSSAPSAPAHAPASFRSAAAAPAVTRGTPVSHAAPAPVTAAVSTLDVMLAVAAAIVGLAALGTTIWMWQL